MADGTRKKVLLVEDDEDDVLITRALLEGREGARFDLDWVETADAALAALKAGEHDVALID